MNRGTARRRLRLRRKRKDGTFAPKASDARNTGDVADLGGSIGTDVAAEVVFRTGCCLLEAVVTAAVFVALMTVPAYLLLHRVT